MKFSLYLGPANRTNGYLLQVSDDFTYGSESHFFSLIIPTTSDLFFREDGLKSGEEAGSEDVHPVQVYSEEVAGVQQDARQALRYNLHNALHSKSLSKMCVWGGGGVGERAGGQPSLGKRTGKERFLCKSRTS
jgi:hypothetical protein